MMIILGVETSCDDTCLALLEAKRGKFKTLVNFVSSQAKLHAKYGGVFPSLAKREHQKNLPLLFNKIKEGVSLSKIRLIGVSAGPGLEPCLWTGINFAKNLAQELKLPLVPVNHIEAHILINFLKIKPLERPSFFPAIALIVSGGHTQLILMKKIGGYKILGETRDDAAGECLDKTARILGLEYPGGPAIARMAKEFKKNKIKQAFSLPRPMISQKNYHFSFSGLKTAVLYLVKDLTKGKKKPEKEKIIAISREIQQAVIDVLLTKTIKAAKEFKAKSVIVGGGVSANQELRRQFRKELKKKVPLVRILFPEPKLSTDNALMTALSAYFHQKETITPRKLEAKANLRLK